MIDSPQESDANAPPGSGRLASISHAGWLRCSETARFRRVLTGKGSHRRRGVRKVVLSNTDLPKSLGKPVIMIRSITSSGATSVAPTPDPLSLLSCFDGTNTEVTMSTLHPALLARAKNGRTISLCFPAHNEADTIYKVVSQFTSHPLCTDHVIDEVVVIDDRSTDSTARAARRAGAIVHPSNSCMRAYGESRGKGDALWRSLALVRGDIVIWCDADLESVDPTRIAAMAWPLLIDDGVVMSKGYFPRATAAVSGGGRVTELVARPLLSLFFPEVAHLKQPLSGMCAVRRSALEQVSFESDYGVDIGLVIDLAQKFGSRSVVEVDIGEIDHRHRPLDQLAMTSMAVQRTILERAGVELPFGASLHRIDGTVSPCPRVRRPPMTEAIHDLIEATA